MISKRRLALGIAIFIVAASGLVWFFSSKGKFTRAETGPYSISGIVYDLGKTSSTPVGLSGVTVTDSKGHTTTTSSTGAYTLSALPAGNATLTFSRDGSPWDMSTSTQGKGIADNSSIASAHRLDVYAVLNAKIMTLLVNPNNGYPLFNFMPTNPISRADMAVTLSRALGLGKNPQSNPNAPVFRDVPSNYTGWQEIEAAYFDGTVSGYPDGTFRPINPVTRAQLAVFIAKALKLDVSGPAISSFPDVSPPNYDWAIPSIEALKAEGIVTGYADGTYKPEEKVTRQQLATYLVRSFKNIAATKGGYDKVIQNFALGGTLTSLTNEDTYLNPCGNVGKVWGILTNSSNAPIAGARIVITTGPEGESYSRVSREGGAFNFYNIPKGSYGFFIYKPDRSSYDIGPRENMVSVETNQIIRLDLSGLK